MQDRRRYKKIGLKLPTEIQWEAKYTYALASVRLLLSWILS